MGISSQLAVVLLREHRYRPITGSILSIGRQTVFLSPEQSIAVVERELGAAQHTAGLEIDTATRASNRGRFITDRSFYSLFSDASYRCLDLTAYEGADLIADLCQPLPPSVDERFDFIEALAVVIAEKGPASSWERSPVQFEYRSTGRFEDRDGKREIAHQTVPNDMTDPYVAAALRFHRSQRPALFASNEKISLPSEFLHYSPETPYCGSLLPIEQQ